MFVLPNNSVVAPVTTPVFSTPEAGETMTSYCSKYRANDPNTIATIGAMIILIARTANSTTDTSLRTNCRNMFVGNAYVQVVALGVAPTAAATDDNGHSLVAINANIPNAAPWIVNLVNAAKKKPLSEENVEGFFASVGHSGTKASAVARLMNQISVFFPDEISNSAFRANLVDNIWTTYRITRVTTGHILFALIGDFRALGIFPASDTDPIIVAINELHTAPYNVQRSLDIPEKYKAYACLFHRAAGTPIDKWYQGNKAVDGMPSVKVRTAMDIFRRYLEVKSNVANLTTITTVDGFAAVRDFW